MVRLKADPTRGPYGGVCMATKRTRSRRRPNRTSDVRRRSVRRPKVAVTARARSRAALTVRARAAVAIGAGAAERFTLLSIRGIENTTQAFRDKVVQIAGRLETN